MVQVSLFSGPDYLFESEGTVSAHAFLATFADPTLTQDIENTLLGVTTTGEALAILNNVQASALTENSFAVVPDVSNPEEALALI
ncbi:MAG: hypothetical protein AAF766_18400 [Cyanobacteria bacterium P01_D01_bin.14]